MEIILKEDVKGLGYKFDVVKVKDGYGRNYLIPQGLGVIASSGNLKMRNEHVKQAAFKLEKIKNDALAIASQLEGMKLTVGAKAGESGKIFGAITSIQVAEALRAKGIDIDRRRMSFSGDVKFVGTYEVDIDLHREVKAKLTIEVIAE